MRQFSQKFANLGWLGLEQAVRLIIAFIVMTIVARELGPVQFSIYAFTLSIAGLAIPLARYSLDGLVLRDVAAGDYLSGETVGSALGVSIAATIVALIAMLAAFAFLDLPTGTNILAIMGATLMVLAVPSDVFIAFMRARERMVLVAVPRIAIVVTGAAVTMVLVYYVATVDQYILLRGVESLFYLVAAFIGFLVVRTGKEKVRMDRRHVAQFLQQGLPLTIAGFATMLYMRIDQVMLGQMSTPSELGLYGLAARISETVNVLPVALQATLFAAIVRNHAAAPESFDDYMVRIYDTFGIIAWPSAAIVATVAFFLLIPVFGEAYAPALPMILILLSATPFFFLYYAWGTMITIRGWLWLAPVMAVTGALLNIVLNLALIPALGGNGAAIATVVTYVISSLGICLLVPRLRPSGNAMLNTFNLPRTIHRLWAQMAKE